MKIRGKHIGRINTGKKLHAPSFKVGKNKYTVRYGSSYVSGKGHSKGRLYVERERRQRSHGSVQQDYSGKSIGSLVRPEHSASSSALSGNYRNPLRSKYG